MVVGGLAPEPGTDPHGSCVLAVVPGAGVGRFELVFELLALASVSAGQVAGSSSCVFSRGISPAFPLGSQFPWVGSEAAYG